VINLRNDKTIFFVVLLSFLLLSFVLGEQVDTFVVASSDLTWIEENNLTAREATYATGSRSVEVEQIAARSSQENLTWAFQGGHQMLQLSSLSSSASFCRHIMCKDIKVYWNGSAVVLDPIDPTTIFSPSDAIAIILTTVSINETIEYRWYYRSNSSKSWVSAFNWSEPALFPGEYREYQLPAYFNISGCWPAYNYPRAYKVDVYLDGSPSFSEFFEVTNGGLNSPRMSEDIDENGHPVNVKSRFTIGYDTKAYHNLRFDKIAYFNEQLGSSHNFTTVWIQPDGSINKTHLAYFTDYKDADATRNYWEYNYTLDDCIFIDPSTPVGNWKVEVYLDSYLNNTWMPYGPIATTAFIVGNESVANWTFMVYLDADNTLEKPGIDIFNKIAEVGSSPQINIVVQMDRHPYHNSTLGYDDRYGNWTDCKRFNVTNGMWPTPGNATEDLGEVNMGHPDTLEDFVNWTIENFPANYYFLVLCNHGVGCMGLCFDYYDKTGLLSPPDFLSLPELSQALSGLAATIDVVSLDACSMSMTEVAYQIKDCANVLVCPEGLGYAPAPYEEYLTSLTNDPSILPSGFASKVVTVYIEWCFRMGYLIQNATMSAIDITKITSLVAVIEDFTLELKEKETVYHEQIRLARNLTKTYPGPYAVDSGYLIDLYHFAELTYQYVNNADLRNAADQVMTTLESIIIIERDKACPSSHGLSIFFPDEKGKYEYMNYGTMYEETSFAEDTPWEEFVIYHLDIHESGCVLTIQTPYPGILVKVDEESYETDAEGKLRAFVLPDSYNVTVSTSVLTGPSSRGVFTHWNDSETNPSRIIPVTVSIAYTAYYTTQYKVTFNQSGVNTDFIGTIVTVDGTEYNSTALPVSFWWDFNSTHTFDFQSTLPVSTNSEQYVWNSTSGLSSRKSDSVNISMSDSVIGKYKRQYYLTISTNFGTVNPSSGWHDAGSTFQINASTLGIVDGEGYAWLGWVGTGDGNYTGMDNPATIVMTGPITETASWRAFAWWETLFRSGMLQVILGLVGIVLTVIFVGTAWLRIRRRRAVIKAPVEPVPIEVTEALPGRITTGYGDLDNLLFGGIPENYAVILTSPSCDERDLLIKKILKTGAKEGEVTFYVTKDPGEAKSLAEEFQSNFYLFICNPQADKMIESLPNVFKLKGVENLTDINIALTKAFRRLDKSITGPRRACVEIISDVLLQQHAVQTRRWLTDLITELKSEGFTTLAVMNPKMHPSEEVHAILDLFEGEINIYERAREEKFLKIKKMYNQRYLKSEMPLEKEELESERSEKSEQE
jgi:KaiC/GvpD/RAD55 family RecA-like ATPase